MDHAPSKPITKNQPPIEHERAGERSLTEGGVQLGWHWFIDYSRCSKIPVKPEELELVMAAAATIAGATIVQRCFHAFSPYGLSGVLVIAESHLAVHTWPEHATICVDLFSCDRDLKVDDAIAYLEDAFGAGLKSVRFESRGTVPRS